MPMESVFIEYPLLNSPHLVGIILRAARDGAGRVGSCIDHLERYLERSHEVASLPPEAVRAAFERLVAHLTVARLLEPDGAGGFALTARGAEALAASPEGFATADLMKYPEYAAFVRGLAADRRSSDPHASAYDLGANARRSGLALADNPFGRDSADFEAWSDGWSDAEP